MTLIDLSADFDTSDHEILVQRLEETFGPSGTVLKWFESYLCNRSQLVKIGNSNSEFISIPFGVPQGSVKLIIFGTGNIKGLTNTSGNIKHHD